MSRETTYYCEGPDCESHQTSGAPAALAPIDGWLTVTERSAGGMREIYDYCSWDCVMKSAAQLPPTEVIAELTDSRE